PPASTTATAEPAARKAWAIPAPIRPPPITPTRVGTTGEAWDIGAPRLRRAGTAAPSPDRSRSNAGASGGPAPGGRRPDARPRGPPPCGCGAAHGRQAAARLRPGDVGGRASLHQERAQGRRPPPALDGRPDPVVGAVEDVAEGRLDQRLLVGEVVGERAVGVA